MANKRGRPAAKIDWEKLDMCLSLGATMEICCGYLDLSDDTLQKYVQKEHGMTFMEYRDRKMSGVKLKLLQKAQFMAMNGDRTMLIFCLKNLCGWADKVEHGFDENKKTVVLRYNLEGQKDPSDQEGEG